MSEADQTKEYEVGWGKPPKQRQFQPGRSGNPKGRRRGARTIAQILSDTLNKVGKIREGDRELRVSQREAALRSLVVSAINGDYQAFCTVLKLADHFKIHAPVTKLIRGYLVVDPPLSVEEWAKLAAQEQTPAGAIVPSSVDWNYRQKIKGDGGSKP